MSETCIADVHTNVQTLLRTICGYTGLHAYLFTCLDTRLKCTSQRHVWAHVRTHVYTQGRDQLQRGADGGGRATRDIRPRRCGRCPCACLYVCLYACLCACLYACLYSCLYACLHACSVCMSECMSAHLSTCMSTHMSTHGRYLTLPMWTVSIHNVSYPSNRCLSHKFAKTDGMGYHAPNILRKITHPSQNNASFAKITPPPGPSKCD